MSQPSRTISLEIEVEEGPLNGRVAVGGACQELAGRLGLLTVLRHLLDDPTPGAESSPPPTDTHQKEHPMFKHTTSRVSPATVIASIALFASLGGVGYAAATIGSAQIKNNSVQGKDIKNGTIKSPDIAQGTRNALKGQTGAKGAAGANGTNGTNGANGANGAPGQKG